MTHGILFHIIVSLRVETACKIFLEASRLQERWGEVEAQRSLRLLLLIVQLRFLWFGMGC